MHGWMPHAVKLYLAYKEHGHSPQFGLIFFPVNDVALCPQD
jgi:hypothetical protein